MSKSPILFLTFVSSMEGLDRVLKNLALTVTDCEDEVKPGFYFRENKFIYMLDEV